VLLAVQLIGRVDVQTLHVLTGSIVGLGTGIAQWLVLKRQCRPATRWIAISSMAWTVGMWSSGATALPVFDLLNASALDLPVALATAGVIAGVISGVPLAGLLHTPQEAGYR
jgi:Na+/glutamate symporter